MLSVFACIPPSYVLIKFLVLLHCVSTVPAVPEEPYFEITGRRPNGIYEITYEKTPTLGCDRLFPGWVSEKVSIVLMDEPNNIAVVDHVSGKPATWTWPVEGFCYKPEQTDIDRQQFIYECHDRFWGRQPNFVYQPLPEGEVLRTGKFRNYCPRRTRLAYRTISVASFIMRRRPWYECACLDNDATTEIVRSMSSQCVEAPTKPKHRSSTALIWASIGKSLTVSLKINKVNHLGSQQRPLEPLDLNPAFATIRDQDSSDSVYRACLVNDLESDISLHFDVVESNAVE